MNKIICLALILCTQIGIARATLSGSVGNDSSYFLRGGVGNNRYEMILKQSTAISSKLSTVVRGRGRADLTRISGTGSLNRGYDEVVQSDEGFEGEFLEVYADYLTESIRAKVGLMQLDWVESPFPFHDDFLTPYDLRFGGHGAADENIVPQGALLLSHSLVFGSLGGSLEWLLVPVPNSSRVPLSDNGYGYVESLRTGAGVAALSLRDETIPRNFGEIELGARYFMTFQDWEFTLLGFRGHQRSPAVQLESLGGASALAHLTYPRVVTLGLTATTAGEASVFKAFTYFEPRRRPRVSAFLGSTAEYWERRERIGIGFDYVFSSALKIYSEAEMTYLDRYLEIPSGSTRAETAEEYSIHFRATNETVADILFAVNSQLGFPNFSCLINPEIEWMLTKNLRLQVGGYVVSSVDPRSQLYSLDQTDRIYLALHYFFGLR